ncbi:thioredoxin [Clostridium carboxidivorans P7]|uniref:Thioredoxin n=1 Tax=Clostridium carboxidivorans P7 TaxID=536227 RepID=C6PY72_9CLOT|nr:thioredoxin [Clostridium carboxidivorans]AKN31588.1 thioredoxin [Clostridium carboxidivorans P7]EET85804.1 thioredoxin [Clostridium carboxidivorans P7]EFG87001.1 thioredoxin [Clostridium carboxidivorans P7]
MAKVINSSEFQKDVLNSNETILVDFFAEWCGPCKMVAPVLEELSTEMEGKAKIFKVDVDKSGDLAEKYGITGVPTLMIFKDGKAVDKIVGFQPKEILKSRLQQYSN